VAVRVAADDTPRAAACLLGACCQRRADLSLSICLAACLTLCWACYGGAASLSTARGKRRRKTWAGRRAYTRAAQNSSDV